MAVSIPLSMSVLVVGVLLLYGVIALVSQANMAWLAWSVSIITTALWILSITSTTELWMLFALAGVVLAVSAVVSGGLQR